MADKENGGEGFATAMAERGGKNMEVGKAVLEPVTVVGNVFLSSAKAAAQNQSVIRNILGDAGIEGGGKQKLEQERELGDRLALIARKNGVGSVALGKAVEQMVGGGVAYPDALGVATVMTQFAVGQQVAVDDSAKLLTSLNRDAELPAQQLGGALASIAKFGKDNELSQAELAQSLPGLLSDLKKLALSGQQALDQAFAVLRAKKASGSDAAGGAKDFHAAVEKLRGEGSEAELAKARAAVRIYAPPLPAVQADPGVLAADQQKIRDRSESKWAEVDHARTDLSIGIGNAVRPASDRAAEALTWLADSATTAVKAFPALSLGVAGVAAAVGAYAVIKRTHGMLGVGVGKTLEWMGIGKGQGQGKAEAGAGGSQGVQRVFVTNLRGGGGAGGGGLDLDGRRKRSPLPRGTQAERAAARARAAAPRAGMLGRAWSGTKALGTGLLAARSAVSTALNGAPLVKQLAGRVAVLGAVYQGATLAKALAGNGSDREKANAVGGTVANVAGAVIGGLVGGPAGAMLGSAAGTALWGYVGDKVLDWRDTWKERPAARTSAPPATAVTAAVLNGPRIPAPAAPLVEPTMANYVRGLETPPAPVVSPRAWNVPLQASLGPARAAAVVATVGTAVAAKPAKAAGLSTAPDAEAVLQAAATAAAAPVAGSKPAARAGALAAPAQATQTQFNFKPSISITVQGDVREPRRIADELMPYLRQLFDQYSGQQRRGSMFDVSPVIGEQKWA